MAQWRGPEQNGISRETGLPDSWDLESGENLLWKNAKSWRTRSTPIVMNGKLYTLASSDPGTHEEGEKVICADAATGKVLWENKFNVFLSDVPDTRVAWSCCVGDPTTGRVYAMGVCGYFQCLDGETGKTLWSHSLSEEFGLLSTYGGRTNVPVIVRGPGDHQRRHYGVGRAGPASAPVYGLRQSRRANWCGSTARVRCRTTRPTARRFWP